MTDTDIMKTLEAIASEAIGDCKRDCAFYDGRVHHCAGVISRNALDLIKRRDEEIEEQDQAIINALHHMKVVRAEAIKEFAERLKAEGFHHKNFGDLVQFEDIDNLVKEMTGETT